MQRGVSGVGVVIFLGICVGLALSNRKQPKLATPQGQPKVDEGGTRPTSRGSGGGTVGAKRDTAIGHPHFDYAKVSVLPPGVSAMRQYASPPLQHWLDDWEAGQVEGRATSQSAVDQLVVIFRKESVSPVSMLKMARLVAMFDGPPALNALYEPLVTRVAEDLDRLDGDDAHDPKLIEEAWHLQGMLWQAGRYEESLLLIKSLRPYLSYGTGPSLLANYRYAEALHLLKRPSEAVTAFERLQEERGKATERSLGINRPLDWEFGITLFAAGRMTESIPRFRAATTLPAFIPESKAAWLMLIRAQALNGDVSAAADTAREWVSKASPGDEEVAQVWRFLEMRRQFATHSDPGLASVVFTQPGPSRPTSPLGAMNRTTIAEIIGDIDLKSRDAAPQAQRARIVEKLTEAGFIDEAASVAVSCIHSQPEQTGRVEYFLEKRIDALLKGGRFAEALADSRSLYNVCSLSSMPGVIDKVSRCLEAANPMLPGIGRRFKLQQLEGITTGGRAHLGREPLSEVKANETLFKLSEANLRNNRDWRAFGQGNILLLQGRAGEALAIFEGLQSSANAAAAAGAREGVARAVKARDTRFDSTRLNASPPASLEVP